MSALKVGVVSLVLGAIGTIAILVTPSWFPVAAAVQADRQDGLYLALMIMSSFIMAIVTTFLVYSVWKFRARPGDENRDGPPLHGNTMLEIIWTVVPTVIVVAFAIAGGVVLVRNETTFKNELVVHVQAQQFVWTFSYANGVKSPVLVLEKDRPTEFDITSLMHDVIHSFYVPQFRVKSDAVPGQLTRTYATPDRIGTYTLICTELCGPGHSLMRAEVRVLSRADFEKWLSDTQAQQSQTQGGA
ncbi:MAG: cytochrome c oxidase subunit [Gaiellales bacterium]|nr:cytochrome c oxidase subunit [Gaiellales bacterium]